jgi:hypothetical protein
MCSHREIMKHGEHAQPALGAPAGARQRSMLVGEIEAGDRLVEQQERPGRRICIALRQHAGELDPLAFTT